MPPVPFHLLYAWYGVLTTGEKEEWTRRQPLEEIEPYVDQEAVPEENANLDKDVLHFEGEPEPARKRKKAKKSLQAGLSRPK